MEVLSVAGSTTKRSWKKVGKNFERILSEVFNKDNARDRVFQQQNQQQPHRLKDEGWGRRAKRVRRIREVGTWLIQLRARSWVVPVNALNAFLCTFPLFLSSPFVPFSLHLIHLSLNSFAHHLHKLQLSLVKLLNEQIAKTDYYFFFHF